MILTPWYLFGGLGSRIPHCRAGHKVYRQARSRPVVSPLNLSTNERTNRMASRMLRRNAASPATPAAVQPAGKFSLDAGKGETRTASAATPAGITIVGQVTYEAEGDLNGTFDVGLSPYKGGTNIAIGPFPDGGNRMFLTPYKARVLLATLEDIIKVAEGS